MSKFNALNKDRNYQNQNAICFPVNLKIYQL